MRERDDLRIQLAAEEAKHEAAFERALAAAAEHAAVEERHADLHDEHGKLHERAKAVERDLDDTAERHEAEVAARKEAEERLREHEERAAEHEQKAKELEEQLNHPAVAQLLDHLANQLKHPDGEHKDHHELS